MVDRRFAHTESTSLSADNRSSKILPGFARCVLGKDIGSRYTDTGLGCRNDSLLVRLSICINSRILNMHLWHSFENEYVKCLALVSLRYESIVKIVNELITK